MSIESKRTKLVAILNQPTAAMSRLLAEQKERRRDLDRPDFIWYFLLQSFATMGNSRGWRGVMGTPANYNRVTFDALVQLNPKQRAETTGLVMSQAKVRMPQRKARWLAENFDLVQGMGGLEGAKRLALAQPGIRAKIAFMKGFRGIGDKYARNIWMDVYHPDFHHAIAVDERIKRVSEAIGCTFSNYTSHEQFYLDVARDAGLQGWELDRLLYNFRDIFLEGLQEA